ncbi:MAG: alpha/beta fold hydrolase [Burkholderiales bacterium]
MALLKANGVSLAWEECGEPRAPPMVLVMGLGMPLVFWPDAFVEGLAAAGFRVIRFDNRDSGLSQRIDQGSHLPIPVAMARAMMGLAVHAPYTLADMAADTAGLLDALGIARAHLVGVSLGGMVAQVAAARHPGRVASLVSIMSSSGNPFVALARPRALGAILHRPGNPDDPASVTEHLLHVMEVIGSPGYPADREALRAQCERVARRGYDVHGTARQLLAVLASGDRREELERIAAPTLVVHGLEDPLMPKAAGREVAKHVRGARLLEFEGMGHDLPAPLIPQIVAAIAALARGQ